MSLSAEDLWRVYMISKTAEMQNLRAQSDATTLWVALLGMEDGEAKDNLSRQTSSRRRKTAANYALDLIQTHHEEAAGCVDRLARQHLEDLLAPYARAMEDSRSFENIRGEVETVQLGIVLLG
jgi:DNA transposition AAA+ family ATPase